jgi:hypothetical protein
MLWYRIMNAQDDGYGADREAEDLMRRFAAALHEADIPGEAEVFYGRTATGERLYYFSLSPEALELTEQVLTSYGASALAKPPDLTGMQKMRRL